MLHHNHDYSMYGAWGSVQWAAFAQSFGKWRGLPSLLDLVVMGVVFTASMGVFTPSVGAVGVVLIRTTGKPPNWVVIFVSWYDIIYISPPRRSKALAKLCWHADSRILTNLHRVVVASSLATVGISSFKLTLARMHVCVHMYELTSGVTNSPFAAIWVVCSAPRQHLRAAFQPFEIQMSFPCLRYWMKWVSSVSETLVPRIHPHTCN